MASGEKVHRHFDRRAAREFHDLPLAIRRRLEASLEELAADPFHRRSRCDIRRLEGQPGWFAVRVGRIRATYTIDGDHVVVWQVRQRRVAYR